MVTWLMRRVQSTYRLLSAKKYVGSDNHADIPAPKNVDMCPLVLKNALFW